MATMGLTRSASAVPVARHRARAAIWVRPWVVRCERYGGISAPPSQASGVVGAPRDSKIPCVTVQTSSPRAGLTDAGRSGAGAVGQRRKEGADPSGIGAQIASSDTRDGSHIDPAPVGGGAYPHHDVILEVEPPRDIRRLQPSFRGYGGSN